MRRQWYVVVKHCDRTSWGGPKRNENFICRMKQLVLLEPNTWTVHFVVTVDFLKEIRIVPRLHRYVLFIVFEMIGTARKFLGTTDQRCKESLRCSKPVSMMLFLKTGKPWSQYLCFEVVKWQTVVHLHTRNLIKSRPRRVMAHPRTAAFSYQFW